MTDVKPNTINTTNIKSKPIKSAVDVFNYIHLQIQNVNNSKLFAGLMIITLNIASKFVTIKLSKSMEAYLKYTFSRQILVFAIAWMGTRDIYVALAITIMFIILMEYLFHEESAFCCLTDEFKDYHLSLLENDDANKITDEDIRKAKDVLERAKAQNKDVGDNLIGVNGGNVNNLKLM